MIPPKRFDISPPDWGMLRRSRRVQIFLEKIHVIGACVLIMCIMICVYGPTTEKTRNGLELRQGLRQGCVRTFEAMRMILIPPRSPAVAIQVEVPSQARINERTPSSTWEKYRFRKTAYLFRLRPERGPARAGCTSRRTAYSCTRNLKMSLVIEAPVYGCPTLT